MSEHVGHGEKLDAAIIEAQAATIQHLRVQRQEDRAEIERLKKLCCMCEGDCCRLAITRLAEIERLRADSIQTRVESGCVFADCKEKPATVVVSCATHSPARLVTRVEAAEAKLRVRDEQIQEADQRRVQLEAKLAEAQVMSGKAILRHAETQDELARTYFNLGVDRDALAAERAKTAEAIQVSARLASEAACQQIAIHSLEARIAKLVEAAGKVLEDWHSQREDTDQAARNRDDLRDAIRAAAKDVK